MADFAAYDDDNEITPEFTFPAIEMAADNLPEFTFAEIIEMEKLFKGMREKLITQELCQQLSAKFSSSGHRSEKPPINWEQVQRWFEDKKAKWDAKIARTTAFKRAMAKKAALIRKRETVPIISASEAAVQLPKLMFEARSAKDYAWFDVASFLNYRVLSSGELLVRVRFAGFGKEEDEWVSVKRAVRERSIPLEHSECNKVNVGDIVLCFRENEDHALYSDAHVVEIARKLHDMNACTCIFVVRFEYDNLEGRVTADKICYRPTQSVYKDSFACAPVQLEPNGVQEMLIL